MVMSTRSDYKERNKEELLLIYIKYVCKANDCPVFRCAYAVSSESEDENKAQSAIKAFAGSLAYELRVSNCVFGTN